MMYRKIVFLLCFVFLSINMFSQNELITLLKENKVPEVENELKLLQSKRRLDDITYDLFSTTQAKGWAAILDLTETIGYSNVLNLLDRRYLRKFDERVNDEHIVFYQKLLEDYQAHWLKEETWDKWYSTTSQLAINSYFTMQPLKAGPYYSQLMEHIDVLPNKIKQGAAISAANHFMGVVQDYDKAEAYYQKALALCSSNCVNKVYPNLAELYLRRNDFDRALEYASEILNSDSIPNTLRLVELTRIGRIQYEKGDKTSARKAYLKAEKLLTQDETVLKNNSFIQARYIYVYTGLLELAVEQKMWKNARIYENKLVALMPYMQNEGQLNLKTGEQLMSYYLASDQAEKFTQFNAVYQSKNGFGALSGLALYAKMETLKGDFLSKYQGPTEALQYYDNALSLLKNSQSEGTSYQYTQNQPQALVTLERKLSALYRLKQKDSSSVEIKQSLYTTAQQAVLLLDQIRQGLSTQNSKLKVLEAAPRIYEQALEATWELYEETGDKTYLAYMYTLIEKSKAILLLETLNDGNAKEFGGVPNELREKEKRLRNDIKIYTTQLDQAIDSAQLERIQSVIFEKRNALEALKKTLESDYPKYYELKYQDYIASLEDVQAGLDACNGIFISYFLGKRHLYVFSVDGSDMNLRVESMVGNRADGFIEDLVDFRNQLADISKVSNWTPELHQMFLKRGERFYHLLLESELQRFDKERLIISPDGLLHYLPFEAILTETSTNDENALQELPYLLHQYAISYNYTATLWLQMMQDKSTGRRTKGMLGITAAYDVAEEYWDQKWMKLRRSLGNLDGAKEEVTLLKKRYSGHFAIGESATEKTFKTFAEESQIIHLAMHGLVDNTVPMRSGLIFTEDSNPKTDNILFAYEISSLDLDADLVVLSACSTGDGLYRNGEGVMSLGRSFMYAGASSLLTTLWQINDQATERIMGTFYEKLSEGLPKDQALREAKLTYLKEVRGTIGHPMFWAAYVMMGNINPIVISAQGNWILYVAGGFLLVVLLALIAWKRSK